MWKCDTNFADITPSRGLSRRGAMLGIRERWVVGFKSENNSRTEGKHGAPF